jgi:hypothetical protein
MRPTVLLAVSAACLAACTQTPKDMLTGGPWSCAADDESKMEMAFQKDGKLAGKMTMADPSVPPPPDAMKIVLEFGGSWTLTGDSDLTFGFKDVKVTEAKRGDQNLEPAEAEFFKGMLSDADSVSAKIASISGNKLVIAQDGKDDLTCTR